MCLSIGSKQHGPASGRLRILLLGTLISLCQTAMITGQTVRTPEPGDQEMYVAGLRFVEAINAYSLAQPAGQGKETRAGLLHEINLTESDYVTLISESHRLMASMSPSNAASQSATQRAALIGETAFRLSTLMSPQGWTHFTEFINGPFRRSTRIVGVAGATTH